MPRLKKPRAPRVQFDGWVSVCFADGRTIDGQAVNLSESGILIRFPFDISTEQPVEIRFSGGGLDSPLIIANARIARQDEDLFGLMFSDFREGTEVLQKLIRAAAR